MKISLCTNMWLFSFSAVMCVCSHTLMRNFKIIYITLTTTYEVPSVQSSNVLRAVMKYLFVYIPTVNEILTHRFVLDL